MITMSDRGPDSAGIALYGNKQPNLLKLALITNTGSDFDGLDQLVPSGQVECHGTPRYSWGFVCDL